MKTISSSPQGRISSNKPSKNNVDVNKKLSGSMRNLSLINQTSAVEKNKFQIGTFIHQNLMTWTKKVFNTIGANKKEISYHIELKQFLLSKGFDVGYEVPLRYQRQGSKSVIRRADLIVSMPGISEQILIECKAKNKIEKKDFEQVIFYRQHFGISECYLVNFRHDPQVLRLKE